MSIAMLRSIASTRRVSSGTSPNTSQNHAAAVSRLATASPTWSSRAAAAPWSAMDVQPGGVRRQVRREAARRVAFRADFGQTAERAVRQEPVLPPGEVGIAQVHALAVGRQL